jgi:hypothetical protein
MPMTEFQTIDPNAVDRVLGEGARESWQAVQERFGQEQSRAEENQRRYAQGWANGLRRQLDWDLARARKAVEDYQAFLARVSADGQAEAGEGAAILGVLVPAVAVLGSVNDVLDDMVVLRIHAAFTALDGAGLEIEAKSLQLRLRRLQEEFDKARREIREGRALPAINAALAALAACSRPIDILARGATGLSQAVADSYLGLSASDPATWGGRGNRTLDPVLSAWERYIAQSSKMANFTGPTGKAVQVEGFFFHPDDVVPAYSSRRRLRDIIYDTRDFHQWYVSRLKANHAALAGLPMKFDMLCRNVQKKPAAWTGPLRRALEITIKQTGYSPQP